MAVGAALAAAVLVGASTTASAGRACSGGARGGGYSYAGHDAAQRGHGIRATIALTRAAAVDVGHVAGWVGVGGPGQGANGEDAWIQAGIASTPETEPFLYAEIAREGRDPEVVLIDEGVRVGGRHRIAVLEMAGRPGWWRVWADGRPATEPIHFRRSSGRWAPIATAESWNAGTARCNSFGFRFEHVSVSYGGGGSWRPFVPDHRFLDAGYTLRDLAAAAEPSGRMPSYAFVAASG